MKINNGVSFKALPQIIDNTNVLSPKETSKIKKAIKAIGAPSDIVQLNFSQSTYLPIASRTRLCIDLKAIIGNDILHKASNGYIGEVSDLERWMNHDINEFNKTHGFKALDIKPSINPFDKAMQLVSDLVKSNKKS